MMNPKFSGALLSLLRLQQRLVSVATVSRMSRLNAQITLAQMRQDHAVMGEFLDDIEQRLKRDADVGWSAQ
jgi:hypothetical protein